MTTQTTSLTETLKALKEPFDRSVIKKLKKGGASLDYVPVSEVIARLNSLCPEWSMVDSDAFVHPADPHFVIAKVTIEATIDGVTRRHIGYGGQKIKYTKDGSGTVDLGDEFKGAQSDALKKAAQQLGVGLHLARTDEALAYEADSEAEGASDDQYIAIEAYVQTLKNEDDQERLKAFTDWWKRNIGKKLSDRNVTAEEAESAIVKFGL